MLRRGGCAQVPEEYKELSGPYEKAFRTMGILLEDSGWVLQQEGEEGEEEEEEEMEVMGWELGGVLVAWAE